MKKENNEEACMFCTRTVKDTDVLLHIDEDAFICNHCSTQIFNAITGKLKASKKRKVAPLKLLAPAKIKMHLDDYIIGQDKAKKQIAVAVYNHYKRINSVLPGSPNSNVELDKSNVLLVGSTGTGKTLMARTVARLLDVPFSMIDATSLTQAGYVGDDVENILTRLLQACNYDVEKAERGIVFVDEIDKLSRKGDNPSITKDVSGEGVQQAVLKMLEGSIVNVPPNGGRKHPDQPMVQIDTKNILFLCGGAFEGIEKKILQRMNQNVVGYGTSSCEKKKDITFEEAIEHITPDDLKHHGMIPELIGRLPVICALHSLTREDLKRILLEPKNSLINQYRELFKMDNAILEIEDGVLDIIVDKAVEAKLGARGLRGICETIMLDIMFDRPENQDVVITKEYVNKVLSTTKE